MPGRETAAWAAVAWGLAAVWLGTRWLGRVAVEGDSMAPLLRAGDRLAVRRTRRVRPGDVVVVTDPREPREHGRMLVKRLHAVTGAGLDVRGDNPAVSTDSRTFGPVDPSLLRGRPWYRYAPAPRTGPLRRVGAPWRRGREPR